MEEWKDIRGYEGMYQISNLGRVKSLKRLDSINRIRNKRIIKADIGKIGYARVTLFKNAIRDRCLVHRLVAEAFIPNPEHKSEVNHLNRQ